MGHGPTYSSDSSGRFDDSIRHKRATTEGYFTKSRAETFKQRSINNGMDPKGVAIRESRDSDEHPNSLAIIIALDVTGSMGSIPEHFIKEGMPTMMGGIIQAGLKDPQVMFMGIGDHEVDNSPLQVGQFETSDELVDKWLTDVWLEGGGGSNPGESYMLAWYFAGLHTSIDCFEKRGQKGYLFTIGDEPVLRSLPKKAVEEIMGKGQHENFSSMELLDKARKMYNVYHIHVAQTGSGGRQEVKDGWKQLMHDNLIIVDDYRDIPKKISTIIAETAPKQAVKKPAESTTPPQDKTEIIL